MRDIFKKKIIYVVMFLVLIGIIFIFQRREEPKILEIDSTNQQKTYITWTSEGTKYYGGLSSDGTYIIYCGTGFGCCVDFSEPELLGTEKKGTTLEYCTIQ